MLLCCAILSISFAVTKVVFSPLSLASVSQILWQSQTPGYHTTTESEKSPCLLHIAKKSEENLWKNTIIGTERSF